MARGWQGWYPHDITLCSPNGLKKIHFKKKKVSFFFSMCFHVAFGAGAQIYQAYIDFFGAGVFLRSGEGRKRITWQENTVALNLQPLNLGKLGTCGGKGMHLGSLKWPEYRCFLSRCL